MRTHRNAFPIVATLLVLLAFAITSTVRAAEAITVFKSGEELVVRLDHFDLLQQAHPKLGAVVKVRGGGKEKELSFDFSDAAVRSPLIIDLTGFGGCDEVTVTVNDGSTKPVASRKITPVPDIPPQLAPAAPPTAKVAYIEPPARMRDASGNTPLPRIPLPDVAKLRQVKLEQPARWVSKKDITFPVVADMDLPLVGGSVLGRQTAAPNDPDKASIYFAHKKAIYDGPILARWQKFLVEVPVQDSWGMGSGDQEIVLTPAQFQVHLTNEKSPRGMNMLGAGDGDLGQKGEIDTDEQGRIYWRVEGGGAYVVRFDPRTKKFEQPPGKFDFQKFVPPGVGMLNDNLCKVTCTRGRVFFTMCNDTLITGDPGNAHRRRLGGVFSIPQDWTNAAAFEADVRLHVGSWESANPTFYKTPPKADADVRKLGSCGVTEAGLFITTAAPKYEGGPWRLDLDERGNNVFFGEVKSIEEPVSADGRRLAPTKLVFVKGVQKGRELNPGPGAGRDLIHYSFGEITVPRASVRLLTKGAEGLSLTRASKHAFPTYPGAPQGMLTIRYDLIGKLKATPEVGGPFAASLSGGASLGPAFLVTAIPGEAGKALAVCEYTGYPLSILDFSNLKAKGTVGKSFLPASAPVPVGLGPYSSLWVRHADEQWLYVGGYTGLARIQYAQGGKPLLEKTTSTMIHGRMAQKAVDGYGRSSPKKHDGIIPIFGGRLMECGYGISGRGGDAFSTGVQLFDPSSLSSGKSAPSQTAAYLSRCFSLRTLQSRMVWRAQDGSRRQEVFAASGSVRREFINELSAKDKSLAPANLDAKIFCYEVSEKDGLRDLFGFSLPSSGTERAVEGHIALSPCNRFLVILTQEGVLHTYSIAQKRFIDGLILAEASGAPVSLVEFKRPSEILFSSPDGQLFLLAGPAAEGAASVRFNRIIVDDRGRLGIAPHVGITCASMADCKDFDGIVRCFLPDLQRRDGSYDFVLGYNQSTVAPFVRVIPDFIPPSGKP